MKPRKLALVFLGLLSVPGAAVAGPIEFGLGAGNLTYTNPNPGADSALAPFQPPGPVYSFDPATGTPTAVAVVQYLPQRIAGVPAWSNALPNGTYHWDVNGYYALPLTLTDFASGQSATVSFSGQAHMTADGSPSTGWTGSATFSSQFWQQVRLGGNLYSIWGTNSPTAGTGAVEVWVGDGTPPITQFTPEPGTFALVAFGLVPLGLRRLRRVWESRSDAARRGV